MSGDAARAAFLSHLRAITDPVRIDIVDALMSVGGATSTELGRMVPSGKGAMRWHIKKLEEAGFIRPRAGTDPVVWEPTRTPVEWGSDQEDPEVALAVSECERVLTDRRRRMLAEWADARYGRPWAGSRWAAASVSRDYLIPSATVEDLEALDEEILGVMSRFRERVESRDPGEGAESVFVSIGAFPWRPRGR